MSDNLGMAAQLAGQSLRFGWYFALNRLVDWRTSQLGLTRPRYKPTRPVPSTQELLADQAQLLMSDALAVRDGSTRWRRRGGSLISHLSRAPDAGRPPLCNAPDDNDATTAKAEAAAADVPDWYAQDFTSRPAATSEESARSATSRWRRCWRAPYPRWCAAPRPIAEFMRRDQRHVTPLDVACGTGASCGSAYSPLRHAAAGPDLSRTTRRGALAPRAPARSRFDRGRGREHAAPDAGADIVVDFLPSTSCRPTCAGRSRPRSPAC
jgi:hypothetical protein